MLVGYEVHMGPIVLYLPFLHYKLDLVALAASYHFILFDNSALVLPIYLRDSGLIDLTYRDDQSLLCVNEGRQIKL